MEGRLNQPQKTPEATSRDIGAKPAKDSAEPIDSPWDIEKGFRDESEAPYRSRILGNSVPKSPPEVESESDGSLQEVTDHAKLNKKKVCFINTEGNTEKVTGMRESDSENFETPTNTNPSESESKEEESVSVNLIGDNADLVHELADSDELSDDGAVDDGKLSDIFGLIQEKVRFVDTEGNPVHGTVETISPDGYVIKRDDGGEDETYQAEDVLEFQLFPLESLVRKYGIGREGTIVEHTDFFHSIEFGDEREEVSAAEIRAWMLDEAAVEAKAIDPLGKKIRRKYEGSNGKSAEYHKGTVVEKLGDDTYKVDFGNGWTEDNFSLEEILEFEMIAIGTRVYKNGVGRGGSVCGYADKSQMHKIVFDGVNEIEEADASQLRAWKTLHEIFSKSQN